MSRAASPDDAVIVEFGLRGTHTGEMRGQEPTGNSLPAARMTAYFVFDDDAIVCERVY